MGEGSDCAMQLIHGDGYFDMPRLEDFVRSVDLQGHGSSYTVVAIMGPQSSGKSTLLNHLFNTKFVQMGEDGERKQTTQGVWIAKAVGIKPLTIVMDLEGTDGVERAQQDTTFEKRSALFAVAVADIFMINMWSTDIGRDNAANLPLIETIFQVMLQLELCNDRRKATLMYVIRDKPKRPFGPLEKQVRQIIQKVWDKATKPEKYNNKSLNDFFNVKVIGLPSYDHDKEEFEKEVAELRQGTFVHSMSPGNRSNVPSSGFPSSTEKIWKCIMENKDIEKSDFKIIVATMRCEAIAKRMLELLKSDEEWKRLLEDMQSNVVAGFGKTLSFVLKKYLSEYDKESMNFEESLKKEKRKYVESEAYELFLPAYNSMLEHLHSKALTNFKTELKEDSSDARDKFAAFERKNREAAIQMFNEGYSDDCLAEHDTYSYAPEMYKKLCNNIEARALKMREKLCNDMDAHASQVRDKKLTERMNAHEKEVLPALRKKLRHIFKMDTNIWASVRKECDSYVSMIDSPSGVAGFELDPETYKEKVHQVEENVTWIVQSTAEEAADEVLDHMKDRFFAVYTNNVSKKVHDEETYKEACLESLRILATFAALRLSGDKTDNIENVLSSTLMGGTPHNEALNSSEWKEVPIERTLIKPIDCKKLWMQLMNEIGNDIRVATDQCEVIANRKLELLASDEDWKRLLEDMKSSVVGGYGKILKSVLEKYLSEYNTESMQFEKSVKEEKRKYINSKAFELFLPAYNRMLEHLRSKALTSYQSELKKDPSDAQKQFATFERKTREAAKQMFNEGCPADALCIFFEDKHPKNIYGSKTCDHKDNYASQTCQKLCDDIEVYASQVRDEKLTKIIDDHKGQFSIRDFHNDLEGIFDNVNKRQVAISIYEKVKSRIISPRMPSDIDIWVSVRRLCDDSVKVKDLKSDVAGFGLDEPKINDMVNKLKKHAKDQVEGKAREAANDVYETMKNRFCASFNYDDRLEKRVWRSNSDIEAILMKALKESLEVLATFAAMRLSDDETDNIKSVLTSTLMDPPSNVDDLNSDNWDKVPTEMTLITPRGCKVLWNQLLEEIRTDLDAAIKQQNNRKLVRKCATFVPSATLSALIVTIEGSSGLIIPEGVEDLLIPILVKLKAIVDGTNTSSGYQGEEA